MDVFSLWMIALLSVGFGAVTRRTAYSASWAVVIPWAVLVAVKVAMAAVFS
ncbi:MAG: hypothetical protein JXO72_04440 [Vicinamibacteria bacterium]|nr:hypothetical protein [Vicinamibacteria bacterium]